MKTGRKTGKELQLEVESTQISWPSCTKTLKSLHKTISFVNVCYIEITSWLVSAYDFYSRVVKDR